MKCDFVVGQQVVCIKDEWPEHFILGILFPPRVPMLNEVLTISGLEPSKDGGSDVFLQFEEIERKQPCGLLELNVGFNAVFFRPLTTRKTDISIFKKMLTPAGRIPVDA